MNEYKEMLLNLNQLDADHFSDVILNLVNNNTKIKNKVQEVLANYKYSKRPITSQIQARLYHRSIQHLKDNLETDLAIQLLEYRLRQFVRWFSYIYGNPVLNKLTYRKLKRNKTYNKYNFFRKYRIIY